MGILRKFLQGMMDNGVLVIGVSCILTCKKLKLPDFVSSVAYGVTTIGVLKLLRDCYMNHGTKILDPENEEVLSKIKNLSLELENKKMIQEKLTTESNRLGHINRQLESYIRDSNLFEDKITAMEQQQKQRDDRNTKIDLNRSATTTEGEGSDLGEVDKITGDTFKDERPSRDNQLGLRNTEKHEEKNVNENIPHGKVKISNMVKAEMTHNDGEGMSHDEKEKTIPDDCSDDKMEEMSPEVPRQQSKQSAPERHLDEKITEENLQEEIHEDNLQDHLKENMQEVQHRIVPENDNESEPHLFNGNLHEFQPAKALHDFDVNIPFIDDIVTESFEEELESPSENVSDNLHQNEPMNLDCKLHEVFDQNESLYFDTRLSDSSDHNESMYFDISLSENHHSKIPECLEENDLKLKGDGEPTSKRENTELKSGN